MKDNDRHDDNQDKTIIEDFSVEKEDLLFNKHIKSRSKNKASNSKQEQVETTEQDDVFCLPAEGVFISWRFFPFLPPPSFPIGVLMKVQRI